MSVGHSAGDRRALDPRHGAQVELRHRHQGAGVAGRDRDIGLALLHRVDREPHRRLPAALAQRLARLVVHLDHDVGVDEPRGRLQPRPRVEQRRDHGLVAEQHELGVGMAGKRKIGPGNDDRRPDVAPHGVERNSDLLGHVRPGRPSCARNRAAPRGRTIAVRRPDTKGLGLGSYSLTVPFFFNAASAANGCAAAVIGGRRGLERRIRLARIGSIAEDQELGREQPEIDAVSDQRLRLLVRRIGIELDLVEHRSHRHRAAGAKSTSTASSISC